MDLGSSVKQVSLIQAWKNTSGVLMYPIVLCFYFAMIDFLLLFLCYFLHNVTLYISKCIVMFLHLLQPMLPPRRANPNGD